jgi:hypothetical protein
VLGDKGAASVGDSMRNGSALGHVGAPEYAAESRNACDGERWNSTQRL